MVLSHPRKTTGGLKQNNTEPPPCVIYPKRGKGNARSKPGKSMVSRPKRWDRESVTQGEGISTPHVRRTRRDPRSKRKKRLLKQTSHTHTLKTTQVEEEGRGLDRISHPMPTYLVWNENQSCRSSAHARQTRHTQTQANVEPECQSLVLHRLPNQTDTH